MKAALTAELRKFLTIRSTYVLTIFSLALAGFVAFWGLGYKANPFSLQSSDVLVTAAITAVMTTSIFTGVLAILHICHEFRYNTINYTLTASNSRLRILFAKFAVMTGYGVLVTAIALGLGLLLTPLGASMAGHTMAPQTIEIWDTVWRTMVFLVGNLWLGLIIGFLARSVVAAVTVYFLISPVEALIHNFLKVSTNYLPTSSQMQIVQNNPDAFSPAASAGVFGIYLAIGIVVSALLFVRRDASS
jgi:hypothetical protein